MGTLSRDLRPWSPQLAAHSEACAGQSGAVCSRCRGHVDLQGLMVDYQEAHPLVPQLRLDELLAELQVRLQNILATRDRTHALLEAVVAVGGHLDLEVVLRRIVETAVSLVDARYGALGVIGEGGTLVEFVPVGLGESEISKIDHWPEGQ